MSKKLINDNDLKIILNVDGDTILNMIGKGMPHYYYENNFYFNYQEVQDWLIDAMELGYVEQQAQNCQNYIERVLKEELDTTNIKEQLRSYIYHARGFANEKVVWLYKNCLGKKFDLFQEYIRVCFPGIKRKHIYKYYIALLQTLIENGAYERDTFLE